MLRILLIIVFFPLIGYGQTPNSVLSAELDTFIQNQMASNNIPGLSACIVKENQVIWKAAYGTANFNSGLPVTTETEFTLASISKLFTATACVQLWENEQLDLDVDINTYLPVTIVNPYFPNSTITVRHLLEHRSSLRDYESDLDLLQIIGDPTINLTDFCNMYFLPGGTYYDANNFNSSSAPGIAQYWYSNAGFTLLGYIIQEVSGMTFEEYCQVYILNPLQMNTAGWYYEDMDADDIAMPYNNMMNPIGYYSVAQVPAAMLKANVEELANFLLAYTQQGIFQNNTLFSQATFEEIVPSNMQNGLGWWGMDTWYGDSNGDFWSHGGYMHGVRTQLNYYPSDSTGLIILTNGEGIYSAIQNEIESYIPLFNTDEAPTSTDIVMEENKKIKDIFNVNGQLTQENKHSLLFYLYDNGTVEKKIILE
jgi:CubicO group peptidase (beta-lactamase class C family)